MLDPSRRVTIVETYARLEPGRTQTEDAIRFVQKRCNKRSISHFLDTASDKQVIYLERILGVTAILR